MERVDIDQTELRVSRLGFGTASLHHQFQDSRRQNILAAAFASGITHFDTSPYYGYGLAESDLGIFVKRRRVEVTIATKVGLYPPGMAASGSVGVWLRKLSGKVHPRFSLPQVNWRLQAAERSLNASLKRLRTDYVDILFLHEPDQALLDTHAFLAWLEALRSKGKIRYWGLAGLPTLLRPWIEGIHPLASVLQTKDSLARKEADVILARGRKLQFTYGYLTEALREEPRQSTEAALRLALNRNVDGAILISSRRLDHLAKLTSILK